MDKRNSVGRLTSRGFCVAMFGAVLAGCGDQGSTFSISKMMGDSGNAVLTSADLRAITSTKVGDGSRPGRVHPNQINCLEPSPDIAKAVSSNFNLGASLGITGLPSGITPDLAVAFANARAEAVAQMTNRLATIQLLRDGLYRACEAYANGAISDTTYAVLLSRYDDTMVTLLMGELAAGNFGGKLAAIGGSTGGGASATLKRAIQDEAKAQLAEQEKTAAEQAVKDQEANVATANQNLAEAAEGDKAKAESDLAEEEGKLKAKQDELKTKTETAELLQTAAANSSATATVVGAGGKIELKNQENVARELAEMQRKYIENINSDALAVACISALDRAVVSNADAIKLASASEKLRQLRGATRDRSGVLHVGQVTYNDAQYVQAVAEVEAEYASTFQTFVATDPRLSYLGVHCLTGIMPQMIASQTEILKILKTRTTIDRQYKQSTKSLEQLIQFRNWLEKSWQGKAVDPNWLSGEDGETPIRDRVTSQPLPATSTSATGAGPTGGSAQ